MSQADSFEKKFDVVIVGAGVIGSSIAYFLSKESKGKLKVGVIERNSICAETSSGAAGMLAAQIETDAPGPFLNFLVSARDLYGQVIPELKELSGIDPHYSKSGIAALARDAQSQGELKRRMEWQKSAGLPCEWWGPEQFAKKFPFLKPGALGGLWAPHDGQVVSAALGGAFAEAAQKLGAEFFEYERYEDIPLSKPRVNLVETSKSKFHADRFIFAAGPWTGQLLKGLVPVAPVKGQLLMYEMPEKYRESWQAPVYCGHLPGPDPIACYFVPKSDGQLLVGATMENRGFDRSENKDATAKLSKFAAEILPDLPAFSFKGTWQGLRPGTPDQLPVVGQVPGFENVFVASGHLRNGILMAPLTGKLFAELILSGKTPASLQPFSPGRFLEKTSSK